MTLIEEARALSFSIKEKKEADRKAKELADLQWDRDHAVNMIDNMKSELRDLVLNAARKGEDKITLTVYSFSTGRPTWFKWFTTPFEDYLESEGFGFSFDEQEDKDHFSSGWYNVRW